MHRRTKTIGQTVTAVLLASLSVPPAAAQVNISNACPPDRVPPAFFHDTYDNAHEEAIDCVVWYGIATGVTEHEYRPRAAVRRDQMASFMARTVYAMRGELPEPTQQQFRDLEGNVHARAAERLAAADIVSGTTRDTYGPTLPVQRAQMATFLVRTYEYLTGETLTASKDYFTDDEGSPHEGNINKVAEAGFASGLGGGKYGPTIAVRRDQMATFIARTINRAVDRAPGGRLNPYPMGTSATLVDQWQMSVVDSDPNANDEVAQENQFNDPPASGTQFYMVRVRATYTGEGSSRFEGSYRLRALGQSGVTYSTFENSCGVIPDELEDPETFKGGTIEGNVCFEVRQEDVAGLLLFDSEQEQPSRPYFRTVR